MALPHNITLHGSIATLCSFSFADDNTTQCEETVKVKVFNSFFYVQQISNETLKTFSPPPPHNQELQIKMQVFNTTLQALTAGLLPSHRVGQCSRCLVRGRKKSVPLVLFSLCRLDVQTFSLWILVLPVATICFLFLSLFCFSNTVLDQVKMEGKLEWLACEKNKR